MRAMRERVEEIKEACSGLEATSFMEVCGTHTVAFFRSGVKSVLPQNLRLVSGPGCPVCVTSQGYIDAALDAAQRSDVTICTYGDMLRVPGSSGNLERHRARGANIVVCYSILDALRYAERHPDAEIIFLAVGFETTAPATAMAILEAKARGLRNFAVLNGHKRVMPALKALLSGGDVPVDGFLLPGHVSVVIGSDAYRELASEYGKACVVAGFEPAQLLQGILDLILQVREGKPRVENVYGVAVRAEGNQSALDCLDRVFVPADTEWRAMGTIPQSGFELREPYKGFDALVKFGLAIGEDYDPPGCRCGEVIQGKVNPDACPLFGEACTHENPVGPCMVSSEGTCAAWYRYARPKKK